MGGSFRAGGEDIWLAVLEPEVRISGPGEDIGVAVLAGGEDTWARLE